MNNLLFTPPGMTHRSSRSNTLGADLSLKVDASVDACVFFFFSFFFSFIPAPSAVLGTLASPVHAPNGFKSYKRGPIRLTHVIYHHPPLSYREGKYNYPSGSH